MLQLGSAQWNDGTGHHRAELPPDLFKLALPAAKGKPRMHTCFMGLECWTARQQIPKRAFACTIPVTVDSSSPSTRECESVRARRWAGSRWRHVDACLRTHPKQPRAYKSSHHGPWVVSSEQDSFSSEATRAS
jgi:hypothetical protein